MLKITVCENKALLFTPYNPVFVSRIKAIGGANWVSAQRAWSIPVESVESARAIMREVYGQDDTGGALDTVTVRITTHEKIMSDYHSSIFIMGRPIASAFSRDSGARVCDGVEFIKGMPTSGGSRNHWLTIIPENSEFVVRRVLKREYESAEPNDTYTVELVCEEKRVNKEALLKERAALESRLSEIDALLKSIK